MVAPGLYVHVPFCRSKCPYCGFYSVPSRTPIPIWFEGIRTESLFYKGRFGWFDSLYLGGGTPTFLHETTLTGLIDHLLSRFDFSTDTEFTIEANPCDLTEEKVRCLKACGCNRVNVGIQSFDDRELSFLGRSHTAGDAKKALTRLRRFRFDNVSVDLIYGLPGQTLKGWVDTLNDTLSFEPEHISCYQLTLEEKTVFGRLRERGGFCPLDEETERTLFLTTSRFLTERGYVHYEISNFARDEAHCSRHNQKYWDHVPYLGLGPSAHSFDGKKRWWNTRSIRAYGAQLERGGPPIEGRETLTDEQLRLEAVALGLRTRKGVDLRLLSAASPSGGVLSRMEREGFVRRLNGRILPTEKGYLVADQLPLYLSG